MLTFKPHVRYLCKKTGQKLNAFFRIACSLKFELGKLLNAFITSQFSFALVVWILHIQTFQFFMLQLPVDISQSKIK